MSEYRNANDPTRRNEPYDLNARGGGSAGWIAGAVVVVILLALAFGAGHMPNQSGTDRMANNAPMMTQPAPAPSGPASSSYTPAPMNPENSIPANPVPSRP
jgi:hypothetical protein